MIYLDTHVVVWLYAGLIESMSANAIDQIQENEILVSPVVRLELQYLYEIRRITVKSDEVISDLTERIGVGICHKEFNNVMGQALKYTWTRDPFDRIIVAHAAVDGNTLITKDQAILQHYANAVW